LAFYSFLMSTLLIEGMLADLDGVWFDRILIENGIIVDIGDIPGEPDLVFDDDCLIFAGMGDIHIHAREDVTGKECHKETFATAAAAALHGGLVHVADMPNNPAPPIDDATYAAKESLIRRGNFPVHYTLYAGIGKDTRPLYRNVPYKAYLAPTHGDLHFESLEQADRTLLAYRGQWVSFHCEDPICLKAHENEEFHEHRRPASCEVSATRFALDMIEKHQLNGKLCHYSAGEGLELIRQAKEKRISVTAEVTPHHLFFDTSMLSANNRFSLTMNPPLRSPADRLAMIEALRDGTVDYLATDHAPHTVSEKARGLPGLPHLDTYGVFVSWLIAEQGFKPERIAEVCSANPGRFANNFCRDSFGRLWEGYVGSLTVINMKRPETVHHGHLLTRCGWSPFDGMTFPGSVEAVIIRGQTVYVSDQSTA
jgi:dihydroorotase